jgi:hypothetical protein
MWAFVASMASIMTILMTIPVMNQRHYWLLYGLGVALAMQRTSNASLGTPQRRTTERRDVP